MKLIGSLLLVLALSLEASGNCGEATTYYLDPKDGHDGQECTSPETACKSATRLQTFFSQAQPGSQVLIKRGTTLIIEDQLLMKKSGTADNPIVVGAYGDTSAARPILNGTGMGGGAMVIQCNNQHYWTIRDLEIRGNKGAIEWSGCHDHLFQSNTMSACNQECAHIQHNSYKITLKDNLLNAPTRTEGIYIGIDPEKTDTPDQSHDITIDSNEITNGKSHECIEVKQGSYNITIINNNIHDNTITQNGCIFSSRKDPSTKPGNIAIKNNTIRDISGSYGYGIRIRNDTTISGNTVSDTEKAAIYLEQTGEYPTFTRNVTIE